MTPSTKWPHSYWQAHKNPTFLWPKPVHRMGKTVILSASSTDLIITYLEAIGSNQSFFSSPNTCWRFFTKPRLNPFLSGPFWNTGAEKASANRGHFSGKKWKSMANTLKQDCASCSHLKTTWFTRLQRHSTTKFQNNSFSHFAKPVKTFQPKAGIWSCNWT